MKKISEIDWVCNFMKYSKKEPFTAAMIVVAFNLTLDLIYCLICNEIVWSINGKGDGVVTFANIALRLLKYAIAFAPSIIAVYCLRLKARHWLISMIVMTIVFTIISSLFFKSVYAGGIFVFFGKNVVSLVSLAVFKPVSVGIFRFILQMIMTLIFDNADKMKELSADKRQVELSEMKK